MGFQKISRTGKFFKGKSEEKRELPDGRGGSNKKNPSEGVGGNGYFLKQQIYSLQKMICNNLPLEDGAAESSTLP